MYYLKNSAKALVIRDHQILLLKKQYDDGAEKYTLPGGTQEPGETLVQALVRECDEEIGIQVQVAELCAVYEHRHPSNSRPGSIRHKVEFAFRCLVPEDYQPHCGPKPDSHQVGVEWHALDALPDLNLSPSQLAETVSGISVKPDKSEFPQRCYFGLLGS